MIKRLGNKFKGIYADIISNLLFKGIITAFFGLVFTLMVTSDEAAGNVINLAWKIVTGGDGQVQNLGVKESTINAESWYVKSPKELEYVPSKNNKKEVILLIDGPKWPVLTYLSVFVFIFIVCISVAYIHYRKIFVQKEASLDEILNAKYREELKEKLESRYRSSYDKDINRFEKIKTVTYGIIEFPPITSITRFGAQLDPKGAAIKYFFSTLEKFSQNHLWCKELKFKFNTSNDNSLKNVLSWNDLENLESAWAKEKELPPSQRVYPDIILTPMYMSHTRQQKFNFCNPIYYADIGCFITKSAIVKAGLHKGFFENSDFSEEQAQKIKLGFTDLKYKLRNMKSTLHTKSIPAEMHDLIINKHIISLYTENIESEQVTDERYVDNIQLLFKEFHRESKKSRKIDFLFAEVLSNEREIITTNAELRKNGDFIINILKNDEMVYPASFIVRDGSETLRRLVNWIIFEGINEQVKDSKKDDINFERQVSIHLKKLEQGI
jgi:hypothetical protein